MKSEEWSKMPVPISTNTRTVHYCSIVSKLLKAYPQLYGWSLPQLLILVPEFFINCFKEWRFGYIIVKLNFRLTWTYYWFYFAFSNLVQTVTWLLEVYHCLAFLLLCQISHLKGNQRSCELITSFSAWLKTSATTEIQRGQI